MADLQPSAELPRARLRSFQELMQRRVQRILLVSSLYDSFIMSEEGQLDETLLSQFLDLNLTRVPDLVRVSSGERALELLESDAAFDLVIVSINLAGEVGAAELAARLAEDGTEVPVVALAYSNRELHDFALQHDTSLLDGVFLWQGDVRILLAIVTIFVAALQVYRKPAPVMRLLAALSIARPTSRASAAAYFRSSVSSP